MVLIALFFVLVIVVENVQATPPTGLDVEFRKWGLLPCLFGNCFQHNLLPSYSRSYIKCRSLKYSSEEPGINEGWKCDDSDGRTFVIPYSAFSLRNLGLQSIELLLSSEKTGFPETKSYIIQSGTKTDMIFDERDTGFSISFAYD